MNLRLVLILITINVLLVPALGQKNAQDWCDIGIALYDLGNNDEAIKALDKAIAQNSEYAYAWNAKGLALDALDRIGA